ncbi:MAG TPA: hypothetical protein VMV44_03215, partial [Rectinemataceae bacterium]|nr:hypothetical protein [Rectinemataceae bacterium]
VVFEGSGTDTAGFRCVALVERSQSMMDRGGELASLISGFAATLSPSDSMGVVTAGMVPTTIAKPSNQPDLGSLIREVRGRPSGAGRFDLGLRQSVNALLPSGPRDAILYFSTGSLDDASLKKVSVSELAALLSNNGISFHIVLLGEGPVDPSLAYLASHTGGSIISAEGPRGIQDLASLLRSAPSGRYDFSFVSQDDPDFGSRQLTMAIEAWLFQKSGRDELGYYAPLQ